LGLCNSVGVIDADYRGNIGIPVINNGLETIWIEDGERIAQLILQPYITVDWNQVTSLDETKRGEGGFNSTGTK